jgi:hypothetical protein
MALNNHDQERIRAYLLGHLSDDEQQKIEERLMLEDDLFEELEISKGELIEEYRAGELSQKDRDWLERHFLASQEGKQQYTFALALERLEPPIPLPSPSPSWFQRLQAFLRTSNWEIPAATAAAVLVVILLVVIIPRQPQTSVAAVTISNSALTRSTSGVHYAQVAMKPDVGEVRLTLTLPEGATPGVNYRAELDNRRDEPKSLKPSAHDTNSVLVVIPAGQLPPGLYALSLFAIQADGTEQIIPGYYFFAVERED